MSIAHRFGTDLLTHVPFNLLLVLHPLTRLSVNSSGQRNVSEGSVRTIFLIRERWCLLLCAVLQIIIQRK